MHLLNASSACAISFRDMMLECNLTQFIKEPVRDHAILDLVLCTDAMLISDVCVGAPFGTSDHNSVSFRVHVSKDISKSCVPLTYDFRNANIELLRVLLSSVSWPDLFESCSDIEDFYAVFRCTLFDFFEVAVPKRCVSNKVRKISATYS